MALGQTLQGCQCVRHSQKVGLRIKGFVSLGHLFDYELAHTTVIQVLNVTMTIVTLCFQGKKQCFFGETKTTAIGEQPAYLSLSVSISSRSYERGNLFYTVFHTAKLGYFFCNSEIFNIVLSINMRYSSESGLNGL